MLLSPVRTHRVIYTLMTNGYGNKYELDTHHTIEDILDMYEACLFNLHNKATVIESCKKRK